jgi:hypothetical protein
MGLSNILSNEGVHRGSSILGLLDKCLRTSQRPSYSNYSVEQVRTFAPRRSTKYEFMGLHYRVVRLNNAINELGLLEDTEV